MTRNLRPVLFRCLIGLQSGASGAPATEALSWTKLPSLPEAAGLGGSYAGISENYLIVAGGTNFPEAPPWENGRKVWHNRIYGLPTLGGSWSEVGKLTGAVAYGVSLTTPKGLFCIGGADAQRHYREAFILTISEGRLRQQDLPALPITLAYASGAVLGSSVYIAGGTEHPESIKTLSRFWRMDLSAAKPQWHELDPWAGPGRMLAVMGADSEAVYLFSGVELQGVSQGKVVRCYLRDAYRYKPDLGWTRIPDLPRPAVAAPSPAPLLRSTKFIIASGDDGTHVGVAPEKHPGFGRDILFYDTGLTQWGTLGTAPAAQLTAPTAKWNGSYVLVNGETRPGMRTADIWSLKEDSNGF